MPTNNILSWVILHRSKTFFLVFVNYSVSSSVKHAPSPPCSLGMGETCWLLQMSQTFIFIQIRNGAGLSLIQNVLTLWHEFLTSPEWNWHLKNVFSLMWGGWQEAPTLSMCVQAYVFLDTWKTVTVLLLAEYFITQMHLLRHLRQVRGKGTQTENKRSS